MELLVERKRRILHLTLNRPHKRNALTAAMCKVLCQEIKAVQQGHDVGVVLISAVGNVFCAGVDLDEAIDLNHSEVAAIHDELFTIGAHSRKPIVIAVNGAALGAGLGLVAQGHIVTASTGAAFGLPEIKVGLWPFMIYSSVEAALGYRRTQELCLTGRLFYSPDALQWGLVHNICAPAEVFDRAYGFAMDLAKASPEAIGAGLDFVQAAQAKTPAELSSIARDARCKALQSEDFREGFAAFKAKRPAHWPSLPGSEFDRAELVAADKLEYGTGR